MNPLHPNLCKLSDKEILEKLRAVDWEKYFLLIADLCILCILCRTVWALPLKQSSKSHPIHVVLMRFLKVLQAQTSPLREVVVEAFDPFELNQVMHLIGTRFPKYFQNLILVIVDTCHKRVSYNSRNISMVCLSFSFHSSKLSTLLTSLMRKFEVNRWSYFILKVKSSLINKRWEKQKDKEPSKVESNQKI